MSILLINKITTIESANCNGTIFLENLMKYCFYFINYTLMVDSVAAKIS